MINFEELMLSRIQKDGFFNAIMDEMLIKEDNQSELIRVLKFPGGMISKLSEEGRLDESSALKMQIKEFVDEFGIYL